MEESTGSSHLLSPSRIGAMTLKNRMVMAPMVTNFADEDGFVTERTIAWYGARAAGGVGLVIVEATCVQSPVGRGWRHGLVIDDDRYVPGLGRLAAEVHKRGAKVALQLHHAGRSGRRAVCGVDPVGPSAVPEPVDGAPVPKELTVADIHELVRCFARGAERAVEAGFDGIELHGAHRYLGAQFLSKTSNIRADMYGGPLQNRCRFLCEVVGAVKAQVGPQVPVWCRLNGCEYGLKRGISLAEARKTAELLEKAGADAIHVSALGWGIETHRAPVSDSTLPGPIVHLARSVKKSVGVPVLAVGILSPSVADRTLCEGSADFVCFAREVIADSEFPDKLASGRQDHIRPCIGCQACVHLIRDGSSPLECAVNATAGHEGTTSGGVPSTVKRVMVVGGGPAGMEAARVTRLRGHSVTLHERQSRLGGQLLQAGRAPWKERIEEFMCYQAAQLEATGVEVVLNQEVTPTLVSQVKPDAVVVATGAKPLVPDMPGIGRPNVVTAVDVMAGRAAVGDRAVIVGGELIGCEIAEFLADRGREVTVVRRGSQMAVKVLAGRRVFLIRRLEQKGVVLLPGVQYGGVVDEGLLIVTPDGKTRLLVADNIVLAAGAVPCDDLYARLLGTVKELHRVGDCVQPRGIMAAIHEGNHVGREI